MSELTTFADTAIVRLVKRRMQLGTSVNGAIRGIVYVVEVGANNVTETGLLARGVAHRAIVHAI